MRFSKQSLLVIMAAGLFVLSSSLTWGADSAATTGTDDLGVFTMSVGELKKLLPALIRAEDRAAVKFVNNNMEDPTGFRDAYFKRVQVQSILFMREAPAWLQKQSIYRDEAEQPNTSDANRE